MEIKETPEEKVLNFLEKFEASTPDVIATGTGIFKLNVHKVLKKLAAEDKVTKSEDEPSKYSVSKANNNMKTMAKNKPVDEVALPTSRDITKLKFQGKEYGKGQLVLALVRAHVEKNPKLSLEKLKEIFPDDLQPRYGMLQLVPTAKKLSQQTGRDRHFLKTDQILTVGRDKKKVVVSNQWSSGNIGLFIKLAKSLGYRIS